MIEVFKTNVKDRYQAHKLLDHIHRTFLNYQANFDLEDCDKVLRIACSNGFVYPDLLIDFLSVLGCKAEVLADDQEVVSFKG